MECVASGSLSRLGLLRSENILQPGTLGQEHPTDGNSITKIPGNGHITLNCVFLSLFTFLSVLANKNVVLLEMINQI